MKIVLRLWLRGLPKMYPTAAHDCVMMSSEDFEAFFRTSLEAPHSPRRRLTIPSANEGAASAPVKAELRQRWLPSPYTGWRVQSVRGESRKGVYAGRGAGKNGKKVLVNPAPQLEPASPLDSCPPSRPVPRCHQKMA